MFDFVSNKNSNLFVKYKALSNPRHIFAGVGYYLSSCVNPLLYSVMSKRFRRGFSDMFKRNNANHSTNSAVACAVAALAGVQANGEDIPNNPNKNGRTLTRFELKMAPRHVIPNHNKADIVRNAFKKFDEHGSGNYLHNFPKQYNLL